MNGRRATGPLFIRKATKWTQLLSTQVTSFIEPHLRKTDNDRMSKDAETECRWKEIGRSSLHWYVQKLWFTSFIIIDYQTKSLWPLLWNVFQNDLHYMVKHCALFLYADDHQLSHAAETIKEVEPTLNEEGNKVSQWCDKNLLKGNFFRYQTISFGPKQKNKKHLSQNGENRGACEQALQGSRGYGGREGKRRRRACTQVL